MPGGTVTAIRTGLANTNNIITQNGAGTTYAAGLARAYTGGSYTDWYLPSTDELNKLYLNKVAIGAFGNLDWSSSECTYNGEYALFQVFDGGYQGCGSKYEVTYVRAVRSF